jgi:hypothetical protein
MAASTKARRYLASAVAADALAARKMAFISGPRQVGKTTLAKSLLLNPSNYRTWEQSQFRLVWTRDSVSVVNGIGPGAPQALRLVERGGPGLRDFFRGIGVIARNVEKALGAF